MSYPVISTNCEGAWSWIYNYICR